VDGHLNVFYKNNGTVGGYNEKFSLSTAAVPEPNSELLNALAFSAVIGVGLMFKRQQKNRQECQIKSDIY